MKKTKILLLTFLCFFLFNSCTKIGEKGRLFLRFINDNTFKYVEDKIRINPDGDNKNPIINGDYIEIKSISSFNYVVDYIGSNISSCSCGRDFDAININYGTSGKNGSDKYVDINLKPSLEPMIGTPYSKFIDKSVISTSEKSTYTTNSGGPITGEIELFNQVISGDRKTRNTIKVVVPANIKTLQIRTTETPPEAFWNECDLFVKRGSAPTCNDDPYISYSADCASLSQNRAADVCKFNSPIIAGDWYIMLYNYNSTFYSSRLIITYTK